MDHILCSKKKIWELSQVIFLKLIKKILLAKLRKFRKWHLFSHQLFPAFFGLWGVFLASNSLHDSEVKNDYAYGPLHVLWRVSSSHVIYLKLRIIRVICFSNFNFWMKEFTLIPKKLFGTWQFDFIVPKFARLKSCSFLSFSGKR